MMATNVLYRRWTFAFVWTGICLERVELAMPLLSAVHCGLVLFFRLLYFQVHREGFYGAIAMTHDFSRLAHTLPAINELV
jgi:hypothetical protein